MAINREMFNRNFIDETYENINNIIKDLIKLRKDEENSDLPARVLRLLHSVKGAARMLQFKNIESISHKMESVMKGVHETRLKLDPTIIKLLFKGTDLINKALTVIKERGEDNVNCTHLNRLLEKAAKGLELDPEDLTQPAPGNDPHSTEEIDDTPVTLNSTTVRVDIVSIEQLIEQMQNLIVQQFQLKKINEQLIQKRNSVINHETQPLFDKYLEQHNKAFRNGFALIEQNAFNLLEQTYKLRMLPINLILASLPQMVEETALELEKEVVLEMYGKNSTLDRAVLEQLKDPLIHLIRNAIDHGLEKPQLRIQKGKPAAGTIKIICQNRSQYIHITVSDDGAGIDYTQIRKKALEADPHMEEKITELPDEALVSYLFEPGFSTKEKVTDLSGRGVGLDIVKKNLEQIKGRINVNSSPESGTTFELILPLSLATVHGFFAKVNSQLCYIPAEYIDEIVLIKNIQTVPLHNINGIRYRDRIIPQYRLSWLINNNTGKKDQEDSAALILSMFGETAALTVHWIDDYSSRILKPLPSFLSHHPAIQGVVFNDSFDMVPVLHIPELLRRIKNLNDIDRHQRSFASRKWFQKILLVEDSFSTRETEKNILTGEGYRVDEASDGIEALQSVKTTNYSLIITDIEMPRMDGLTLIENIRRDPAGCKIPVIVLSGKENIPDNPFENKDELIHFFSKHNFDRYKLLKLVYSLIGRAEKTYE